MSQLFEKCKACVDQVFIDWDRTKLSKDEKVAIEEAMAWGIVHLALYILDFNEYNALKQYIYDKHGYDSGGCSDGQMNVFDLIPEDDADE